MKALLQQLQLLWKQLGINQRVSIAVAAVGVVSGLLALTFWSHTPKMQLLYGRLSEKDVAEVVSAAQGAGIPYELGAGGSSVYVPGESVHKLRLQLASKGVPSGEGVGFEIFDRANFGISDFVQRTNYVRALQGELSRTVSQLNGVRSAKVMIVLPENRLLFSETKTKPTASVFVEGSVSAESVNSIRFLVANSVEGLRPDDVAVVDHRGTVLTENLKDDPQLGAASSQIKLRKSVEDYFSNKVESMLAKVLGPGAAVVRVSATLDSESISRTEERFDPDGQVLRSETNTEDSTLTNEPEGSTTGGTGVTANSANADSGKPSGKNSEQLRKNRALNYEINRVTTNAIRNPGSIANLSAAVFVAAREKPRTPAEMESLRKIVSNAIGIKGVDEKEISKSISLEEVTFQVPVVQPASALDLAMAHSDWIKNGVAIAIALGLIMMFMRMLKRAAPDQIPIEVLNPPPIGPSPLEEAEAARNAAVISVEALHEMIRQRPGNIGAALRDWMAANGKN